MEEVAVLDTRYTLETAEGTDLPLYPAGFWVRSLAYLIDFCLRGVVVIVIAIVLFRSGLGSAIALIAFFLLEWFYPVFFEVWRDGQTVGKKMMKIKVIHDDGTPVSITASLTRNLMRAADILPFFYIAGIVSSVCNRQFKRLGDLAAGTLVVYSHPKQPVIALPDVGSRPLVHEFSTDEQRELLAFAQRNQSISTARQAELANLLRPLLKNVEIKNSEDRVRTLQQMANYIVGKR